MKMTKGLLLAACALPVFCGTGSAARAETLTLNADLKPSAEVPPNTSAGMGKLTGTYDTATKILTYDVVYSGLTGPATMAHFHGPALTGKNAPVEIAMKNPASPIKETATLSDDQAKNLLDGETYFNVHTAANKGGEIRGQVTAAK
jgi:hypothetical protein